MKEEKKQKREEFPRPAQTPSGHRPVATLQNLVVRATMGTSEVEVTRDILSLVRAKNLQEAWVCNFLIDYGLLFTACPVLRTVPVVFLAH